MKKNYKIAMGGVSLLIALWVFGLLETWYFGWNMTPKSTAEFICDIISGTGQLIGAFIAIKYWTLYIVESTVDDVLALLGAKKANDNKVNIHITDTRNN